MVGVVVTGHNLIADGLVSACDMIIGHHNHCKTVCLTDGVDSFSKKLYETLDEMFNEYEAVIVVSDVKGGTPFNQSLRYKLEKAKSNMQIISGMNLPLFMELVMQLEFADDAEQLAKSVVETGAQSVALEELDEEADDDEDDVI